MNRLTTAARSTIRRWIIPTQRDLASLSGEEGSWLGKVHSSGTTVSRETREVYQLACHPQLGSGKANGKTLLRFLAAAGLTT
jgi:hypothetical protein